MKMKDMYMYIYIYIYIIECVAQLAKASYTQTLGCGFKPHPDHYNKS